MFRKKPSGGPPLAGDAPGGATALPLVDARTLLMEISKRRRNALLSASVGPGWDEFASGQVVETWPMSDAWQRVARGTMNVGAVGEPGSGKTVMLRYLAYKCLTGGRGPVSMLECDPSFGDREASLAAAVPGLLFLDNVQRSPDFARHVIKKRAAGTVIYASHRASNRPGDYKAGLESSSTVGVSPTDVADRLFEGLRNVLAPKAFAAFNSEARSARFDLWTVTFALDGAYAHAQRVGTLTAPDVMRCAQERAADWLRRGLPSLARVPEVASAILPVAAFSAHEVPVPGSFLAQQFGVREDLVARLFAVGELSVSHGNVALHHRSLARLYESAIRGAPDLLANVHPSAGARPKVEMFAAFAEAHPAAAVEALGRIAAPDRAQQSSELLEHPIFRGAVIAALGRTEARERAMASIASLALEVHTTRLVLPPDVAAAFASAVMDALDGPAGAVRDAAATAVGYLAAVLGPADLARAARALDAIAGEPDFSVGEIGAAALLQVARASNEEGRTAITHRLLERASNGPSEGRARALRELSQLVPVIPRALRKAAIECAMSSTRSEEAAVVGAAGWVLSWLRGFVPPDEYGAIAARLLPLLESPMGAQRRVALETLPLFIGPQDAVLQERAARAVVGLALKGVGEDAYPCQMVLVAWGPLLPFDLRHHVTTFLLRLSNHYDSSEEGEDGVFERRVAASALGDFAPQVPPEMRGEVVARLVALLEDPYESYKWGEDAMTEACDALWPYIEEGDAGVAAWVGERAVALLRSPRERVALVAWALVTRHAPHLTPSVLSAAFEAADAVLCDSDAENRDKAAEFLAKHSHLLGPPTLDFIGGRLEDCVRRGGPWDSGHAFQIATAALPHLQPKALRAAWGVVFEAARVSNPALAFKFLTKHAAELSPTDLAAAAEAAGPLLDVEDYNNADAALSFIVSTRARLPPEAIDLGFSKCVECVSSRDWRRAERAAKLLAAVAAEGDPSARPHLYPAAAWLLIHPAAYLRRKGLDIAGRLPPSPDPQRHLDLQRLISVMIRGADLEDRVAAAAAWHGCPHLREAGTQGAFEAALGLSAPEIIAELKRASDWRRDEAARWAGQLASLVSPAARAEFLRSLWALVDCPAKAVRQAGLKAVAEVAATADGDELQAAARRILDVFREGEPDVAPYATGALAKVAPHLSGDLRREALVTLLEDRSLHSSWWNWELAECAFHLKDAAPPEHVQRVAALAAKHEKMLRSRAEHALEQ